MPKGAVLGLLRAVAVLAGVATLTFLLLHLAPGDPASRMLGPDASAAQLQALRGSLGLDRSLMAQYGAWIARTAKGDFGVSLVSGRSVRAMIGEAWPATAFLVIVSLACTYVLGIAIGSWQANARRKSTDGILTIITVALSALPGYWLGLVLVMFFTYRLRWLPAFGAVGLDADFLTSSGALLDRLRHLALPLLTLTLIGTGGMARFARASMSEVRGASFLIVARSKGISRAATTWRHQLRNALVPLVTLLGLSLPALFSGTVFVEAIFGWPGVGQLMVQGVQARDYPVVMAAATIGALLVVIGNLLADLLVGLVDPRARQMSEAT